uniref:Uncharacterized protein n=1 Tax=Solanum lycopersicum TaxID=4081 RepID=A0A3Q7JY48_SOLLC
MKIVFVDVRQDLVYAYGCPSRLVRTIWKVKRSPKRAYPSFRRFSCAIAHHFLGDPNSDVKKAKFFRGHPSRPCICMCLAITASHHFLGDPDSDRKNAQFFRGRPSRPCLCIWLAITTCPTHLEGQTSRKASLSLISTIFIPTSKMPNFFVDVRQDLVFAYNCPSRLFRPIWKVKRAPKRAYPSFPRFSCAITIFWVIQIQTSKMPIFFLDVRQDHVYSYGWPSRLVRPIWKVKRASKRAYPSFRRFSCAIAHNFLGDPDSDVKNEIFFVDVRQDLHTIFWVIRIATLKLPNFFVDVRQDLVYEYGWPSRLVRPIWKVKRAPKQAYPSFRQFSCPIAYHFLGDPDSDVKNAKFFRGLPKRAYPLFRGFSCAIAHHFLGDPESDVKNAKFFRGRLSRPCLCIHLAITACPTHLEGQTSPEASIPLISTIFIPTSKMPNFFADIRQDLVYAYGWPSRLVRPIWKVKRATKRAYPSFRRFSCAIAHHFLGDPDSDVKNAQLFCGRPSRPCLCIQMAITACSTYLEAHHFLGDPDYDVKNAKFFRGRPSRPCLCIKLAITACRPIWKVKRAPKRAYPSFRRFSCAIAHHFLGDPDYDVKNAKFFHVRLSRPCLCIWLAITACPTHFEGQTSPEASIPLISMIFVCYTTPFFG